MASPSKVGKGIQEKEKFVNEAIEITVKEYKKVNEDLLPATKPFFNVGLYFLLAERDVQALKADAFAHPNETKRNIALRALLLTIYEWDMGKVTGRRMRFIHESTGLSGSSKNMVVNALKKLKKARKAIENEISEARHNTIAHREADALLKSLVKAMLEIGTVESLFHQVTYRKK